LLDEELPKELVVAIPGRIPPERTEKEVLPADPLHRGVRIGQLAWLPDQGITERSRELLGNGSSEQEFTNTVRQLAEHLLEQKIQAPRLTVQRDRLGQPCGILVAAQRERNEVEPESPTLAARQQSRELLVADTRGRQSSEEQATLVLRETQLLGADLLELAARAEILCRKQRRCAGDEHDLDAWRGIAQERHQKPLNPAGAGLVKVVEDHGDRVGQGV